MSEHAEHFGGSDAGPLVQNARVAPLVIPVMRELPRSLLLSTRAEAEAASDPQDVSPGDVAAWMTRLDGWFASGDRVAVWSCDAQVFRLLASCDSERTRVQACVDPIPDRQGLFVPTSGHEVEPPAVLRELQPDVVLVPATSQMDADAALAELDLRPRQVVELNPSDFR